MNVIAFLDTLNGWWSGLSLAPQVFFGIAFVATALAVLQAVLLMIGVDGHDALDATDSLDGGSIFSLKPLTGFFLGLGWGGALSLNAGLSVPVSMLIGILAGVGVLLAVVALIRSMLRLASDGTMRISDAVGAVATVYVSLPPSRGSGGQVIVAFSGRQETMPALNASARAVPSGEKVKVTQVIDGRTLLVEPLG